ncbi:insulinase family protein [Streptomyces sp. NPDC002138]|uniref:insulinase family protein n=1 Tax=Streptomyces sp. NPDC002138 TaxID=3154410 RepID=UPI003316962C
MNTDNGSYGGSYGGPYGGPSASSYTDTDTGSYVVDGIRHTTVGGIRTVLAPRSGPVTAGLLFRVGRADETLATSGITHLVEHLALHRHGLGDLHYNGATAAVYTHFHVSGTPADVVEYLNGVCAALRDLPMDRLETEKEILRTEAAGRSRGPGHGMPLWRYGARGHGLVSYAEAGLPRITAHAVREWARTRFTTENAVLWITSDTVPEGLDLTLPAGAWQELPEVTSALPVTPAYYPGEEGGAVLSSVLPRSTGAVLFAEVLGKELFRELRQKGGYSYTAGADYEPRDTDTATIVAYADALPQKRDAMVGAFIDVLAKLRAGRIEQADLDSVRASALARFDVPELAAQLLPGHAMNLLLRHRNLTRDQARAEIEAVTVEVLHGIAREVWANALMQVPGRGVDWAGLTEAPQQSAEVVAGQTYPCLADRAQRLIVSGEGVSLVSPDNQVTVRYADCVLMNSYPDGARYLVGHDGFSLTVEPTLYGITSAQLAPLDAAVPPAAVVTMPPRDPSRIPRPETAPAAARSSRPAPGARLTWLTVVLWVLGVPAVVAGLFTTLSTYLMFTDPELGVESGEDWLGVIILWLLAGVLLVPWGVLLRRRLKGRG